MQNEGNDRDKELKKLRTRVAFWEELYEECKQERDALRAKCETLTAQVATQNERSDDDKDQELDRIKRQMTLLEKERGTAVHKHAELEDRMASMIDLHTLELDASRRQVDLVEEEVRKLERESAQQKRLATEREDELKAQLTQLSTTSQKHKEALQAEVARLKRDKGQLQRKAMNQNTVSAADALNAGVDGSTTPLLIEEANVTSRGRMVRQASRPGYIVGEKEVAAAAAMASDRSPNFTHSKRKAAVQIANSPSKRPKSRDTVHSDEEYVEKHPIGRLVQNVPADQAQALAELLRSLDAEVERQNKTWSIPMNYKVYSTKYLDVCIACHQRRAGNDRCFQGKGMHKSCSYCADKNQPCLLIKNGESNVVGKQLSSDTVIKILPVGVPAPSPQQEGIRRSLGRSEDLQEEIATPAATHSQAGGTQTGRLLMSFPIADAARTRQVDVKEEENHEG